MKRNDLQGIRGVAILLVLLFHLQPSLFPLGFVGVDMFFVLSGFLMAKILSKDPFSSSQLSNFYLRRFKRIVSLMYIILFLVYTVCFFILIEEHKIDLKTDLKWSLTFTSNIQPLFEKLGYWDQVSSYRFLVHCWSLGVEIQFYLFAPFIIAMSNWMSSWKRDLFLIIGIILSLLFQLYSSPKVSYGLLPSRVWQFLVGCLAFVEVKSSDEEQSELEKLIPEKADPESDTNLEEVLVELEKQSVAWYSILAELSLFCLCLAVVFNQDYILSEKSARILGCLIVFFLIRFPITSKSFVSNGILVYIGDISYVMYLVHWPIIVVVKYLQGHTFDAYTTVILFVTIFLISMVLHHSLEKCLAASSLTINFILTAFCLLLIFGSFPYYELSSPFHKNVAVIQNVTIDVKEAIKWNLAQKVHQPLPCKPDTTTETWTNYKEEPYFRCEGEGNGSLKVLVIGNSMAWRTFPTVEKLFRGKYRSIRMYARSSRAPLSDVDPPFTAATHIVVENIRPDILWNIHGDERPPFLDPFVNKTTDPMFLQFQNNIDYYSNRSKVFIIDLPYFWERKGMAEEFRKRLQTGQPLDDIKIPKNVTLLQQIHHRNRILATECKNCLINDPQPGMYDGDWYYLYNRENLHEYTLDGFHFTSEMFEKLMPIYQATVDKALAMVGG